MFNTLKELLPNIPDEVIIKWLLPFAEADGIPDSHQNDWDKKKTGEKLAFWNDAKWDKVTLDITKLKYSKLHNHSMNQLHMAYLQNDRNDFWVNLGEAGKKRFFKCLDYMIKNQVFPVLPILKITDKGDYEVLDGNHRFLSHIVATRIYHESLQVDTKDLESMCLTLNTDSIKPPLVNQEVWVCTPNWNNSPDAQTQRYLLKNGIDIDEFIS